MEFAQSSIIPEKCCLCKYLFIIKTTVKINYRPKAINFSRSHVSKKREREREHASPYTLEKGKKSVCSSVREEKSPSSHGFSREERSPKKREKAVEAVYLRTPRKAREITRAINQRNGGSAPLPRRFSGRVKSGVKSGTRLGRQTKRVEKRQRKQEKQREKGSS